MRLPGRRDLARAAVVVELDGWRAHRTRAQLERDHGRDLVLRQNDFETRRYTERQLRDQRAEVFADLPKSVRELARLKQR